MNLSDAIIISSYYVSRLLWELTPDQLPPHILDFWLTLILRQSGTLEGRHGADLALRFKRVDTSNATANACLLRTLVFFMASDCSSEATGPAGKMCSNVLYSTVVI